MNVGNNPTCIRPQGSSIIDLTWADARLSSKIIDWQVLEEYTASDYMYIYFAIESNKYTNNRIKKEKYTRWAHKEMDIAMYNETLEWLCTDESKLNKDNAALWATNTISDACNASMPKVKPYNKKSMYWWSSDIAKLRKDCNKIRRKWQKAKKRKEIGEILRLEEEYRKKKTTLNTEIKKAKAQSWEELIKDLDRDPGPSIPFGSQEVKKVPARLN